MTWVYFLKFKGHEETLVAFQVFKANVKETSGHLIHRF